jgi:uncharacterized RDD family membrane protein YckC
METEKMNYFDELKELGGRYVEDRLMLIKLEAAEKAAKFSASLVRVVVLSVLGVFVLMIVTFLAGYYLSLVTNSFLLGFGIMAVLYVLIMVIFNYMHNKTYGKSIANKVVEAVFSNKEEEL